MRAARGQYIAIFLAVLTVTYGFFVVIDFVPEKPEETVATAPTSTSRGTEIAYAAAEEAATSTVPEVVATSTSRQATSTESATMGDDRTTTTVSGQETTDTVSGTNNDIASSNTTASGALPVRIEIDALDRVVPVLNPTSRRVADLDEALLSGVVRHPDAANFNQDGNMFILGHSSRLPNVINQNFQAFNDIETLQWGDTIRVYSTDTVYVYRVEKTYEAKASTASVPIAGTGKKLTLATCNSFGSIDDRHIVEAKLVSQQPLQ